MDVSIIHDRDCTRPHYTVGQELAEKERRSTKMKSNVKREREREKEKEKKVRTVLRLGCGHADVYFDLKV